MSSATATPTAQTCRHCGGTAPLDAHFCPRCDKILSLGGHAEYFTFLGLPRKLNLDEGELDRSFRTLSRQFHPDYYHNGDAAERIASLARSSFLNDAYRTLRHLPSRIAYLLELEHESPNTSRSGAGSERAGNGPVPEALLEEVFALNEELDAIRAERARGMPAVEWQPRLERARAPIVAKRSEHEAELQRLSVQWDALVDRGASLAERRTVLGALRDRMLERNYITNLLAGVERELAER